MIERCEERERALTIVEERKNEARVEGSRMFELVSQGCEEMMKTGMDVGFTHPNDENDERMERARSKIENERKSNIFFHKDLKLVQNVI